MPRLACFLFLAFAIAAAAEAPKPQYPSTHWPIENGSFDIRDFRFDTGETLPVLHLHYLTLGELHRDAEGHADNAVLLLHGTGGNAHSLLNPVFSDILFGPDQDNYVKLVASVTNSTNTPSVEFVDEQMSGTSYVHSVQSKTDVGTFATGGVTMLTGDVTTYA